MTLILAYANPEYVVMASDRRIVRGPFVDTDKKSKMAIWEGRLMFGFTGLAEIGNRKEDTILVLANILAKQKKFDPVPIAEKFKEEIKDMFITLKDKRLALLGVGFNDLGQPYYWIISNTHDKKGKILDEANDDFQILYNLPNTPSSIQVYGFSLALSSTVKNNLLTRLRKTRGTKLPSHETIMNMLCGAISDASGPTISKESLVCTMFKDVKLPSIADIKGQHGKAGSVVDFAMPIFIKNGAIVVLPSQRLRISRRKKVAE